MGILPAAGGFARTVLGEYRMVAPRPAAGPASASGVRRWGDEYQDLAAWTAAVELLGPDSEYDRVEIEAEGAARVDDVVRRAKAGRDRYTQLKWSTRTAEQISVAYLTARRGKTGASLLQKLLTSWQRLGGTNGRLVMELLTNRALDREDPLLKMVDGRNDLLPARLVVPGSAADRRLEELVAHLGCGRSELLEMFDHLIFTTGQTVMSIETRARLTMRAHGLRNDSEALRTGVGAVAAWVRDGRRRLDANDVRAEAMRLGLFENGSHSHSQTGAASGLATGADYLEQYRELAPAVLLERDTEIGILEGFCSGAESYLRWQAGPWAGKTALLASFALRPPPNIDVVAFFVTARYAAQADSTAFTDSILDQLTVLLGRPPVTTTAATSRDALRRSMLAEAAHRAVERGRGLALVVDGLDEDTGAAAGTGIPSIAALLPRNPPPGLYVIVASRPMATLPDDVPTDHPLRQCPVHTLAPSRHAGDIARRARAELRELLVNPEHSQILALVTASGGGLSGQDLEELTGIPLYQLIRKWPFLDARQHPGAA